ncbi:M56 family metallopeptidase [Flavobacterium artemisiae]|uniref:M56 family metallopeptidase n=1 Tax=Flavobacterium artemisiae TaxID=2126556 RepID=A0ABW4HHQ2_9FLAO
MEALFIFILKSSGLLATFYFAYIFLLRKETFFNSSRFFLLAGLITSVVLPFVVYTKIIWIEPAPAPAPIPTVSTTAAVQTASTADAVQDYNYTPVYKLQIAAEEKSFEINWNLVSLIVYGIGFVAFMIKFALDFYSLNAVLKGRKIQQQEDFKFIDVNENIAPFSYFDYIVFNSSLYTASELENILEHEKVHSDQKHTIDVLITRIFCILFWFNPIIWLYKKAILQNLEFIADSEASKKITDKKAYQYTLLKITTHETCVAITNHFYQSLIKKRIVMLNKNQSKKRNYWKYYAVIPALGAFVLLFQIETIAQEKKQKETAAVVQKDTIKETKELVTITKNTTDKELDDLKGKLKSNHNLDFKASDVKRNAEKELTAIQIELKSESGKKQTVSMNGNKAIKDLTFAIGTDNNGAKTISIEGLNPPTPPNAPVAVNSERVVIRNFNDSDAPIPPTPPVPPVFPQGPMPKTPVMDMSKMPKAPKPPKDADDKVAMAKFEKDMAEFEKKMTAFEPDMRAFEKDMEETMAKREAIFEKEMAKYEIAMDKYASEMNKYQKDMNFNYNFDFKFDDKDMKLQEKEIRLQERDIKLQEREIRIQAIEMKKQAAEMKKQAKEMKKEADEMRKQEKNYSSKS